MARSAATFLCVLFCLTPFASAQTNPDIYRAILDSIGLTASDIGFRPQGYWNRFPLDIPYRLTSFDDLFAEPWRLYDYSLTMANSVERYLNPQYLDSVSTALYSLTYSVGVDRKLGGFRSYGANLIDVEDTLRPLENALERLFLMGGTEPSYYAFGSKAEYPDYKSTLINIKPRLNARTQKILGRAIINLADIIRWRGLAFRRCNPEIMREVFKIRTLAKTQGDGTVYYPEIDDIAATVDYASLHYAALKAAALAEELADSLSPGAIPADMIFELETPFGKLAILGSDALVGERNYDCQNSLLIIDAGNDGIFAGGCGATSSLDNPVSIFIDLGGDDKYIVESNTPSQGTGILGIGLLFDQSGNDTYQAKDYAQGCGFFGVGTLFDMAGDDKYDAAESAQGAGYFGIGLCFDASGKDAYYLLGDGQGMGGIGGGVGILGDYSGDDSYKAEPYASVYDRSDYHSEHKINGSSAQGVGFGRRGDGSDGHSWAGGLGAIIDIYGNDHYHSGNWSLGCAYWFATGIAIDMHGDDFYESCYFTQGSGAHYCNGILIDEAGNDRHELFETAGAGLGFGWDFTNAFLINIGGNDSYRAKMISMGLAQIRSNAFLIDIGGDDKYMLGKDTPGLGEATPRDDYKRPGPLAPFYTYCNSLGCFIDIGGQDKYFTFDIQGQILGHSRAADNKFWLAPARNDSTYGAGNFGVGRDCDSGTIPEIEKWRKGN